MRIRTPALLSTAFAAVLLITLGAVPASAAVASTLTSVATATLWNPTAVSSNMRVDDLTGPIVQVQNNAIGRSAGGVGLNATAVAVQVALVDGPLTSLAAHNRADAIEWQCIDCTVTALAYQFVVSGPGDVSLTPAGAAQLAALEAQVDGLPGGPGTVATVDAIAAQIQAVLANEVVLAAAGPPALPTIEVLREFDFS